MKYMFLIYSPESSWTDEQRQACMVESMGICEQLAAAGKFITASRLENVPTATTVRVRNGQSLITAGPFAETTEQLGGFYILDLESLDEAIAVASRLPPAQKGTVEIRPIFHLDNLPENKLQLLREHNSTLKPYMLLAYDDEPYWQNVGAVVHHAAMMEAVALTHELAARGQFISAAPLHPTSTATSVRIRNGQRHITDGPFAETREVLGGYYLILAKDQEEALSYAARNPGTRVGSVEVRPLFDVSTIRTAPPSSGVPCPD